MTSRDEQKEVDYGLFNFSKDEYGADFENHSLEQYRIFIGLMDKVTERRLNTNTFFLTANTFLISALSGITAFHLSNATVYVIFDVLAAVAGVLLCWEWHGIIRSYTQLNQGKFEIIHLIEEKLPLSLFRAEWKALGGGANKKLYKPITMTERFIPFIFMILYLGIPVAAFLTFSGLAL